MYYAMEQRWGKWGEERGGAEIVVYSWLLFPVLPDPARLIHAHSRWMHSVLACPAFLACPCARGRVWYSSVVYPKLFVLL